MNKTYWRLPIVATLALSALSLTACNGGGGGGTITISGPAESIQAAGEEITALLNPSEETIHCDINRARDVIGPGGATVKEIQAQTGARIDVNMSTL